MLSLYVVVISVGGALLLRYYATSVPAVEARRG
jgi:hypothetical protein